MRYTDILVENISTPPVLYHATLKKHAASIISNGLTPTIGSLTNHYNRGANILGLVYAADSPIASAVLSALSWGVANEVRPTITKKRNKRFFSDGT